MGWVFDHSPSQGTDRLVLLSIANHAGTSPVDGAWESYPGVDLLQRESRVGRTRTVQESLARLTEAGHIERVLNGAPDERIRRDRRPNLYRILFANGVPCGDTRCRWCGVPPDAERGAASRPNGVPLDDTTGCRETAPKPSVNRQGTVSEPSLAPAAPRTTKATRLPEPFRVTAEMLAWAREDVPRVDLRAETAKFVDYWRSTPGTRARKLDWPATWRNWMRTADERLGRTNGHTVPMRQSVGDANLARLRARQAERDASNGRLALDPQEVPHAT